MIEGITTSIRRNWLGIVLVIISMLVAWKSHVPDTWLTGWDALHPEFDFGLNLKRVFFGVWRADQGLGTIAYHSHMSELPRIVMLWVLSWFLPLHVVRYVFISLCFLLGVLGLFVWVKWLVKKTYTDVWANLAGFFAGLFYLFNLGTVQHFYVVFEMFAVQYAVMGWLFWIVSCYLESGKLKWLFALAVLGFLSSPMAYAATLWYALFVGMGLYCLGWWIASRNKKQLLRRIVILFLVWLGVNAYWLLPQLYVLMSGSSAVPTHSLINKLFSSEAYLRNKSFGSLLDVIVLKNFLFDWQVYDVALREFVELMPLWQTHVQSFWWLGLILGLVALGGILFLFGKKKETGLGLMAIMVFGWVMVANNTSPFSIIFEWLRQHFQLVEEGLRFPFTKFSILLMWVMATGFGVMIAAVGAWMSKRVTMGVGAVIVASTVLGVMIWGLPMFQGGLISDKVQLTIPDGYFELFKHMKTLDEGKIVVMPLESRVGWEYYHWGFQGAGFVWFGMPQGTLVRDFDRWSQWNEGFYNEMSTAMYGCPRINNQNPNNKNQITNDAQHEENDTSANARSLDYARDDKVIQCAQDVERVLEKYDVTYVLLDESIVAPGRTHEILRHEETKVVMSLLGWDEVFTQPVGENDKESLIVWRKPDLASEPRGFVAAPQTYAQMIGQTQKARRDVVYSQVGDYIERPTLDQNTVAYPFATVLEEELQGVVVTASGFSPDTITLKRPLSLVSTSTLKLPTIPADTQMPVIVSSTLEGNELVVDLQLSVSVATPKKTFTLPPLGQFTFLLAKPLERVYLQVGDSTWEVQSGKTQHLIELRALENTSIRLFDATQSESIALPQEITSEQVSQCWTRDGQTGLVDVDQHEGSTQIRVADASGCVSYPLGASKENSLMKISVAHKSEDGARPHFCVDALGGDYKCEHEPVFSLEQQSSEWATVERFVNTIEGTEYFLDLTARSSDQINRPWTIEYQTPRVERFDQLAETILERNVWQSIVGAQANELTQDDTELTITFNSKPASLTPQFMGSTTNCDVFKRGEANEFLDAEGFHLQAKNRGGACAVASLETISVDQNYVLRMQGENISGRSLKFYLSNWISDRADLEYLLDKGPFDQVFGILSWPQSSGSGYSLNLETRSFDAEIAENVLEKADLYPLPLEWLAGITVETLGSDGSMPIQNALTIVGSQKFGTSHYVAEVQNSGVGLLSLSQGFDDGWLGYEVDGVKCGAMCRLMPWWFGERLEHVKVNGWANGYLVTRDQRLATSGDVNTQAFNRQPLTTIAIVFWPQYLEWGGVVLLVVTFVFLSFSFSKLSTRKVVKYRE